MRIRKPLRNRIKELRFVPAGQLRAHPQNWRTHPSYQRRMLRAALDEIGFADCVLACESSGDTLTLIDGHLRVDLVPPETPIPVLVLDLNADEAKKLLATLDPLAGFAEPDWTKLQELAAELSSKPLDSEFAELLDRIRLDDAFGTTPEEVREAERKLEEIKQARRRANAELASERDTERYLVIVFPSRAARNDCLRRLGLPEDERYISADCVEIAPRTERGQSLARRKPSPPTSASGYG